mmetsp:Transcript_17589/g.43908  ORF Transcript_17589/g.43908 Transcript_17589/m.43908 type:complete len:290 (+) Transcript_17589:845-1714(+)
MRLPLRGAAPRDAAPRVARQGDPAPPALRPQRAHRPDAPACAGVAVAAGGQRRRRRLGRRRGGGGRRARAARRLRRRGGRRGARGARGSSRVERGGAQRGARDRARARARARLRRRVRVGAAARPVLRAQERAERGHLHLQALPLRRLHAGQPQARRLRGVAAHAGGGGGGGAHAGRAAHPRGAGHGLRWRRRVRWHAAEGRRLLRVRRRQRARLCLRAVALRLLRLVRHTLGLRRPRAAAAASGSHHACECVRVSWSAPVSHTRHVHVCVCQHVVVEPSPRTSVVARR